MIRISAYQIAEQVNIKRFRAAYKGELAASSSVELFYSGKNESFVFVLGYGVVVFANFDEIEASRFIEFIKPFCINPIENHFVEDLIIHKEKELNFSYNAAHLPEINPDVIRVVMMNTGQSVALDYYNDLSEKLLDESSKFTQELEQKGKLNISKTNLLKFIGKTLNTKNRIAGSVYIFDVPEIVWENEYLDRINQGMGKTFDLNVRFREIEYTLKIVEGNLEIFTGLVQNKTSHMLEMIIILLILVEVVHVFITYLI